MNLLLQWFPRLHKCAIGDLHLTNTPFTHVIVAHYNFDIPQYFGQCKFSWSMSFMSHICLKLGIKNQHDFIADRNFNISYLLTTYHLVTYRNTMDLGIFHPRFQSLVRVALKKIGLFIYYVKCHRHIGWFNGVDKIYPPSGYLPIKRHTYAHVLTSCNTTDLFTTMSNDHDRWFLKSLIGLEMSGSPIVIYTRSSKETWPWQRMDE